MGRPKELTPKQMKFAELLVTNEGRMTATEAAKQAGYTQIKNFARAFKRWTGKTSTEFRNA